MFYLLQVTSCENEIIISISLRCCRFITETQDNIYYCSFPGIFSWVIKFTFSFPKDEQTNSIIRAFRGAHKRIEVFSRSRTTWRVYSRVSTSLTYLILLPAKWVTAGFISGCWVTFLPCACGGSALSGHGSPSGFWTPTSPLKPIWGNRTHGFLLWRGVDPPVKQQGAVAAFPASHWTSTQLWERDAQS